MSGDDSDPEAQGIDTLRLLKQGSQKLSGRAKSSEAVPLPEEGIPLVALLPSQKRSRSNAQDLSDHPRPSGSQKVSPRSGIGITRRPSVSQSQDIHEKDIRQHKSAPEHCMSLAKELRSCKSAPDLTLPTLAAIRGLQNGTLQVDRHTRLKIAAAAKRVLEGRELRRKASQEREQESQPKYPTPTPDPVSPLALQGQPLWDRPSQSLPPSSEPLAQYQRPEGREEGKPVESSLPGADVPAVSGPAAVLPKEQTPHSGKSNFHRPALATVSQGGALISTTYRPFTVTTGLPRFSQEASGPNEGQAACSLPSTPTQQVQGSVPASNSKEFSMMGLHAAGTNEIEP